jgi:hypothetical protein
MCLLIALLLGFAGVFGIGGVFTSASPTLTAPAEAVVIKPTETAAPHDMTAEMIGCFPTEDDLNRLTVGYDDAFYPYVMSMEVSRQQTKDTATWRMDSFGAVAYMEYLHFDCGVSEEQIDRYYSPPGFDVLLSNYDSHEQRAACDLDGLRLYEFDARLYGGDYSILYWVEKISSTRVVGLQLTFPASGQEQQARFAAALYPSLPACELSG